MGSHRLKVHFMGKHVQHPPQCKPGCPVQQRMPKLIKMALPYGEYEVMAEAHIDEPVVIPIDPFL